MAGSYPSRHVRSAGRSMRRRGSASSIVILGGPPSPALSFQRNATVQAKANGAAPSLSRNAGSFGGLFRRTARASLLHNKKSQGGRKKRNARKLKHGSVPTRHGSKEDTKNFHLCTLQQEYSDQPGSFHKEISPIDTVQRSNLTPTGSSSGHEALSGHGTEERESLRPVKRASMTGKKGHRLHASLPVNLPFFYSQTNPLDPQNFHTRTKEGTVGALKEIFSNKSVNVPFVASQSHQAEQDQAHVTLDSRFSSDEEDHQSDSGHSDYGVAHSSEPWILSPIYGIWQPHAQQPTSLPPPPRTPSNSLTKKRAAAVLHSSQGIQNSPKSDIAAKTAIKSFDLDKTANQQQAVSIDKVQLPLPGSNLNKNPSVTSPINSPRFGPYNSPQFFQLTRSPRPSSTKQKNINSPGDLDDHKNLSKETEGWSHRRLSSLFSLKRFSVSSVQSIVAQPKPTEPHESGDLPPEAFPDTSSHDPLRSSKRRAIVSDPYPESRAEAIDASVLRLKHTSDPATDRQSDLGVFASLLQRRRGDYSSARQFSHNSKPISIYGALDSMETRPQTRLPVRSSSTRLPTSSQRPTTATTEEMNFPSQDTVYANRSSIVDHTYAQNQSLALGDMPQPRTESASRSNSTRRQMNLDDLAVAAEEAANRRSVRRAEGKRAESETTTSMRGALWHPSDANSLKSGTSSSQVSGIPSSSSRLPFANVRRIFRSRSKSSAQPPSSSLFTDPTSRQIREEEDEGSEDVQGIAASDHVPRQASAAPSVRRSRDGKSSGFLFGLAKAKSPTRVKPPKFDKEQPERSKQDTNSSGEKKTSVLETSNTNQQDAPLLHRPSSKGKVTSSQSTPTMPERTLTLQALSTVSNTSPYSTRRSSGLISPGTQSKLGLQRRDDVPTSNHTAQASTPPLSARTLPSENGLTPPKANVPRIWMTSRNSKSSFDDKSVPSKHNFDSVTSESAPSFRTARSSSFSPDDPATGFELQSTDTQTHNQYESSAKWASTRSAGIRSAASPLTDLIENLEQRISSSRSASLSRSEMGTPTANRVQMSQDDSSIHALPFPTTRPAHNYDPNFTDVDSVSLRSQSSRRERRNTFGGHSHVQRTSSYSPSDISGSPYESSPTAKYDVSEIETSLAAVEAALHSHRMEGSLDPSTLRPILWSPPRQNMDSSSTSLMAQNGSFAALEEVGFNDGQDGVVFERITLPPHQETAIANAVQQVRRAISSSQLPQIPNEDESVVSHSPHPLSKEVPEEVLGHDAKLSVPGKESRQRRRSSHSQSRESTPMRAARIRQESMQDVEQAYSRMLELVTSASGIDLGTPSPMPASRAWSRRSAQPQLTPSVPHHDAMWSSGSPNPRVTRHQKQNDVPVSLEKQVDPSSNRASFGPSNYQDINEYSSLPSTRSSRAARQQLLRDSDALSHAMAHLPDLSEEASENARSLRGRASNISSTSRRAVSESPPRNRYVEPIANYARADDLNARESKRTSGDAAPSSSAAGSGGYTAAGTSPSVTVKTQGTPRSVEMDQYGGGTVPYHPHSRSQSQQTHDWHRRRLSSSPDAHLPSNLKRTSLDHHGTTSIPVGHAGSMFEDSAQRKTRNRQSRISVGSSALRSSERQSPAMSSTASHPVSGAYPYHPRDGSLGPQSVANRDWGKVDDILKKPRGASRTALLDPSQDASAPRSDIFHHSRGSIGSPTHSLIVAQRRHALERDSLLDMLDRSRTETASLRTQNNELKTDLHQEVTRVLELEREVQRQREREEQLALRVQSLEEELKSEHADRLRIGELLERVQRAVDEAAFARRSVSHENETAMENRGGYSNVPESHPSPTSSSTSLLQEDLQPASQRILDTTQSDDVHEISSNFPLIADEDQQSERHAYIDQSRDEQHFSGNDQEHSPTLHSYPSALGLGNSENELEWTLDAESPPEESYNPPLTNGDEHDSHAEGTSIRQESFVSPRQQTEKRISISGTSRLPLPSSMIPKPTVGMSKSMSNSSTVVPSGSASSVDGQTRLPTSSPANANRTGLAERLSTSMARRRNNVLLRHPSKDSTPSASPSSARNFSTSSSIISGGPLPSYKATTPPDTRTTSGAARILSSGSRATATTGGDTSYSARTVSPVGSFIATLPGHTDKLSAISPMHSAGGYYDPRRPHGYDPVDSSVLDVLDGEDSSGPTHIP